MIARWLEDAFFIGRFLYFYFKAPDLERGVGFNILPSEMPFRARVKTAYMWAVAGRR